MKTVADLGRRTKKKYPGKYNHLADAEVGRRVKQKYPGKYDDFVDISLPTEAVEPTMKQKIRLIQEDGMKDRGGLSAKFRKWQVEKEADLGVEQNRNLNTKVELNTGTARFIESETTIETASFNHEHIGEKLERGETEAIRAHEFNIALQENQMMVAQLATEKGSDARTYIKMEEKRQSTEIDSDVKEKDHKRNLDGKKQESAIKISEHRQMEDIDVEMENKRVKNTIERIIQYQTIHYEAFDDLLHRLMNLMEEEGKILKSTTLSIDVKEEQLKLIQQSKEAYRKVFDAQRQRFMESGNGEVVSGLNEITEALGFRKADDGTIEIQVPVKKLGSGKRKPVSK